MTEPEKFKTMIVITVAFGREYVIIYDSTNAHYDKYISTFEKMLRTVKITEAKFDGIECQSIPHIGVSTSDDISKNPPKCYSSRSE